MKTFLKIIGLSLIWFLVWGIFYFYLTPQGVDYLNRYLLTCIYFLLVIVALTSVFKDEIGGYIEEFSPRDLLSMILFSIAVTAIYYFLSVWAQGSPLNVIKSSFPAMLQLDERFLVTKAFEIMFQQTLFMISIYYIFNNKISKYKDIFLFGLYLLFLHLPILFVNKSMGIILFGVSFFAGLIFSYCITLSKKGFIYSYMIHFGFYVILAAVFWLGGAKYIMDFI